MKCLFCIILLSGVFSFISKAQMPEDYSGDDNQGIFTRLQEESSGEGVINIDQSDRMEQFIQMHIAMNKRSGGVEGFRVQLFSGSGNKARKEALEVKGEVLSQLPDADVFVEYSAPFWRVRVGSFRHKHEALPLLEKLQKKFPACYVVKVNGIPLNEL